MRGRNMLIQHIPDMVHQIIHCEVRLIDIIEYIISLFFIFNQKSDKRCHITDIGHRLPVFAISGGGVWGQPAGKIRKTREKRSKTEERGPKFPGPDRDGTGEAPEEAET